MSVYACVYVMHTAGVLWCSWLVTAAMRVQALRLPSGCKIQELGGRAEDFTVSYPLISTLNVLLKSPSNPWRAFSFGFETRSGSTIGALTFTNEDTVALTLNNRRDDEDEVVNLSRAESLHLRLETWTLLSLSVRDGKLTVAVKDVLQVVFHLVDATPFERVFTHVLLGNYIDVGMDCAQGSTQRATTTTSPPTHAHHIHVVGIVVSFLLALLASTTALWYCKRRKHKQLQKCKTIGEGENKIKLDAGDRESAEDAECQPLEASCGVHAQGGHGLKNGDQNTLRCSQDTMQNDNCAVDSRQQVTAVGECHGDRLSTIHQPMSRNSQNDQYTLHHTCDTEPGSWSSAAGDEDEGTSFPKEDTESNPAARDQSGGALPKRTRSQQQQQTKASGTSSANALEPHVRGSLTLIPPSTRTAKTHTYKQPTTSEREQGDDNSHYRTDTEPAMDEAKPRTDFPDTASEKINTISGIQSQGTALLQDTASSGTQSQGKAPTKDNASYRTQSQGTKPLKDNASSKTQSQRTKPLKDNINTGMQSQTIQMVPELSNVTQIVPGLSNVTQTVPELSNVTQIVPGLSNVTQMVPELSNVTQIVPGLLTAAPIAHRFCNDTQTSFIPMEIEGISKSEKNCYVLACEDDVEMTEEKRCPKRKQEDPGYNILETKRRRETQTSEEDSEMNEGDVSDESDL